MSGYPIFRLQPAMDRQLFREVAIYLVWIWEEHSDGRFVALTREPDFCVNAQQEKLGSEASKRAS